MMKTETIIRRYLQEQGAACTPDRISAATGLTNAQIGNAADLCERLEWQERSRCSGPGQNYVALVEVSAD